MSDDNDLVFNEPIKTGWLRTIVGGDIAHAKSYLLEGRRMVGHLRNIHGVNERIAAGEPGGYFKGSKTMPDGTRIEAYTNNGMDALTIIAPTAEQRAKTTSWEHTTEHRPEGKGHYTTYSEAPTSAFIPPTARQKSEDEEDETSKKQEDAPYMWVGVRNRYDLGRIAWYANLPIMIEPLVPPDPISGKLSYRGIVQDGWGSTGWFNFWDVQFNAKDECTRAVYSGGGYSTEYNDLPGAIADFHENWGYNGQPRKRLEDHCLACDDYGTGENFDYGGGAFFLSINGLRLYSASAFPGGGDGTKHTFPPYDPLMTPEQNRGEERSFAGRYKSPSSNIILPNCGWDAVFVLDPREAELLDPVDSRPRILSSSAHLQSIGMTSGDAQVLPGEYLFSIMCYDAPALRSVRSGEEIPNLDPNTYRRSPTCDYTRYMRSSTGTEFPMVSDVEVRIGKGDYMQTWQFEISVEEGSVGYSWSTPFGYYGQDQYQPCVSSPDVGWNSFGPNYSHPMLAIDVLGGKVRFTDEVPQPVLGGGIYGRYGDPRRTMKIYICGDYFPVPDKESFRRLAPPALFTVLEGISSGVFGCAFVQEPSLSGLQGLLSNIETGYVWEYNCGTGSLTRLPIISKVEDYDYTPITLPDGSQQDSWFKPYYYWYYPYLVRQAMACEYAFALGINSTGTFYYTGSNYTSDLIPVPPTCC